MQRFRRPSLFGLVLTLWLGAGMIAAGAMTIDMTYKVSMADSGQTGGADACAACNDMAGGSSAVDCLPNCNLTHAVISPAADAVETPIPATFATHRHAIPPGHVSGFDPSPPKRSIHS